MRNTLMLLLSLLVPLSLGAEGAVKPDSSNVISASWAFRSAMVGPYGAVCGELWLVLAGEKREMTRIGESNGPSRPAESLSTSRAPDVTILESFSWWAGAGDAYFIVKTGDALSIRHQSLDESGNGEVETLRTIALAPGATVTTGNSVEIPLPSLSRTLSHREPPLTGDDVDYLQFLLKTLGYTEVGEVDGAYGKMTKAAVIRFQKANGLEADGIVGRRTWEKLSGPEVVAGY
jgi:hypothetical protein